MLIISSYDPLNYVRIRSSNSYYINSSSNSYSINRSSNSYSINRSRIGNGTDHSSARPGARGRGGSRAEVVAVLVCHQF